MAEDKMSEAELCAEFRAWAEAAGWTVYPEVENWDLVLVRPDTNSGIPDSSYLPGEQVGIQAKLIANVDVLAQAVSEPGPPFRATLTRNCSSEFMVLAKKLGVGVITREKKVRNHWSSIKTWKDVKKGATWEKASSPVIRVQAERFKSNPLWLPPVASRLVAGGPAPKQLTAWRVKALKMCKLLRSRGYVTSHDFKTAGMSWVRWEPMWLSRDGKETVEGRPYIRFIMTPGAALPDVGWEEIQAAIENKEKENDVPSHAQEA